MNTQIIDLHGKKSGIRTSGTCEGTIVFVHGASSSSITWMRQLSDETLQKKYRLVAIDLPGHGGSDRSKDPNGYELNALADRVKHLVGAIQPKKFVLVALSYGSNIVGEITPSIQGCAGILLVSPCILNNEFSPDKILLPAPFGHIMTAGNPPDTELKEFISHVTRDTGVAERFYHTYRNTDPAFRQELGNTFAFGKWTDELANIKNWNVPVCIVYGKDEPLVRSDYLKHFPGLWNNSLHLIEDAGHMPHEENPDAFNKILASFASVVLQ